MSIKTRRLFALLINFYFILFSSYVFANEHKSNQVNATEMFSEIKNHLPNIKKYDIDKYKNLIPGVYSNYGPTKLKYVDGGTSGSLFYIFPDGSYIYTEWADIMRETIYEKGHWDIKNSFIIFANDNSLPFVRTRSKYHLPFRLKNDNIVIMGSELDYELFRKHWTNGDNLKTDPEYLLLLNTHEKSKDIRTEDTELMKEELMKRAWRPLSFSSVIWDVINKEHGCSLDTSVNNFTDQKIFLDMGFTYHQTGNNDYLRELGITSDLPYIYLLINDFSYKELIDNKHGISNISLDGYKGVQYTKSDDTGEYTYHFFDNKVYQKLITHLKNRTEFSIEFDTQYGLLKSSLRFIYDWYGEDIHVDSKIKALEECINSHNKALHDDADLRATERDVMLLQGRNMNVL